MDEHPKDNPIYRTKEPLQQDDAELANGERFMNRLRQSQANGRAENAEVMELEQKQQDDAERFANGKRFLARFKQAGGQAQARRDASLVLALEQKLMAEGKLIPIDRRSK